MLRHSWRTWAIVFAAATLSGLFFASQSYLLYRSYDQKTIPVVPLLVLALIQAWIWVVLIPGILAAAKRFPLDRHSLLRYVPIHLLLGALFAVADIAIRVWITGYLPWSANSPPFDVRFRNLLLSGFHSNLLVYWAIAGGYQALAYYRKLEERELRASQLETRLAQAQLQVLRTQLQPHFLFNTLHAISTLVYKDPEAADHAIALLSDLLRMTLDAGPDQEVTLQQEIDFVERYIEIEQTRLGDRLAVRLQIADDVRDARVPSFLLQPLVENAIRYGIAPRSEGGRVDIVALRKDGELQLLIQDDGVGFGEASMREGVGLRNTRARLNQLYGNGERIRLELAPGGGALFRLTIPFRSAFQEPASEPA
jgi:hypothetical protein